MKKHIILFAVLAAAIIAVGLLIIFNTDHDSTNNIISDESIDRVFVLNDEYEEYRICVSKNEFNDILDLQMLGELDSGVRCEEKITNIINKEEPILLFNNDECVYGSDDSEEIKIKGEYVSIFTDGNRYAFVFTEKFIIINEESKNHYRISGLVMMDRIYDAHEFDDIKVGDSIIPFMIDHKPIKTNTHIDGSKANDYSILFLTDKGTLCIKIDMQNKVKSISIIHNKFIDAVNSMGLWVDR